MRILAVALLLSGCAANPVFDAARPSMDSECQGLLSTKTKTACRVKVFNRFYANSTPSWMRQLQHANVELAGQVDAGSISYEEMERQMANLWRVSRRNRRVGAVMNFPAPVARYPVRCQQHGYGEHSTITCR